MVPFSETFLSKMFVEREKAPVSLLKLHIINLKRNNKVFDA